MGDKSLRPKSTLESILRILKIDGPSDAIGLASRLRISDAAVRQHLYRLRDENLVESDNEPRPMGRPARIWKLTRLGNQGFPDSHAQLVQMILESIEKEYGEDGLRRIISNCAREQTKYYRAKLRSTSSLKSRLATLVELRNREGYMADFDDNEDGSFLFIENHCSICVAAQAHSELCDAELALFKAVLGEEVSVERDEHLFSGHRRCTFSIRNQQK